MLWSRYCAISPAAFLYWAQTSRAVSRRFVLPAGDGVDIIRSIDRWQIVDSDTARP